MGKVETTTGWISTGDIMIDWVTGGGIPYGRITEILGLEGAGKTTTALHVARNIQIMGKKVVYIDAERCLDVNNRPYAESIGVKFDGKLFDHAKVTYADDVERKIRETFAEFPKNNVGMIIIDSVAGVMPNTWRGEDGKPETNPEKLKGRIGDRAAFWSKLVPYLAEQSNETQIPIILVNQLRKKIDLSWGGRTQDDPMGGHAVKFFKSLSINLQKTKNEYVKQKHPLTGQEVSLSEGIHLVVETLKNRLHPPFQKGFSFIRYGEGFDNYMTALKMLEFHTHITTEGSGQKKTYFLNDPKKSEKIRLGVGERRALKALKKYPKLVEDTVAQIIGKKRCYF